MQQVDKNPRDLPHRTFLASFVVSLTVQRQYGYSLFTLKYSDFADCVIPAEHWNLQMMRIMRGEKGVIPQLDGVIDDAMQVERVFNTL